jgi:hypothetical protein
VKVSSREGIKVVNCEGRMEILIRYDDGTTEIVEASPNFSKGAGASGLRIGESSSATKPYR